MNQPDVLAAEIAQLVADKAADEIDMLMKDKDIEGIGFTHELVASTYLAKGHNFEFAKTALLGIVSPIDVMVANTHQLGVYDEHAMGYAAGEIDAMIGDGHCLYRFMKASGLFTGMSLKDIRCEIAKIIHRRRNEQIKGITIETWAGGDSVKYYDKMAEGNSTEHGGDLEIEVVSHEFNCNIWVYARVPSLRGLGMGYKRTVSFNAPEPTEATRTLHVVSENSHFDLLKPSGELVDLDMLQKLATTDTTSELTQQRAAAAAKGSK